MVLLPKLNRCGTILEVTLIANFYPRKIDLHTIILTQWRQFLTNSQVQDEIILEGVELSTTQWYPKLAEFDFEGWHADPTSRENFTVYGVL
jgi:hypothetical protein